MERKQGALTIVGTGIGLASQITVESLDHIKRAERVLYLAGSAVAGVWLRQLRPDAISLHGYYGADKPRIDTYREMADRILSEVSAGYQVCAVFYGHPGVGVDPAHDVIRRARQAGFRAKMLPAVSAAACLFADLGVDPLRTGCQAFEASYFVYYRPAIERSAMLLLWQIGVVGDATGRCDQIANRDGLRTLADVLSVYYPGEHEAVVYEAAYYPVCQPLIEKTTIAGLVETGASSASTLFVPPLQLPVSSRPAR